MMYYNPPETGFLPCWPRGDRLRRMLREGICEPGESAEDYGRRMRAVVHELTSAVKWSRRKRDGRSRLASSTARTWRA